ncbi:MAG TPA: GNAT family N-acetyltransferase [Friedmanniella sp.]
MPKLVAPVVAPGSMANRAQPVLSFGELVLRPWAVTDVAALVAAYADPAIQRWHVRTMSLDEAEEWVVGAGQSWGDESAASWAVATRAGGLIGRLTLGTVDLAWGSADVRYWVVAHARGKGVASGALRVATGWARSDLGLHRLELEHSTRNEASCRVAEKAGYGLEGTLRSRVLHEDGWHDMHLHAHVGRAHERWAPDRR